MKIRLISIVMAGFALLVLQACGSLDKRLNPIQPNVFIDAIEIEDATLSGLTALLTLNVENPNNFALNARGLDYTMSLAGTDILSGENISNMSVPALGSGKIEVPVRISYVSILETIPKVLETGVASYNFRGSIHTRLFNIPFTKTDDLKLPYFGGLSN
ncbi:MAG: LEA type 2 family protein [Gammaproteobacteria bacterium]